MKSAILNETGTRTIRIQQEQEQSKYTLFYELHKIVLQKKQPLWSTFDYDIGTKSAISSTTYFGMHLSNDACGPHSLS